MSVAQGMFNSNRLAKNQADGDFAMEITTPGSLRLFFFSAASLASAARLSASYKEMQLE
jgi:hypothetical protein